MPTVDEINAQIKALEEQKKLLQKEVEEAAKAKRLSVKPIHRFTFKPVEWPHDKLWDPSCKWFYLNHEILNPDECKAVGWNLSGEWSHDLAHNKGMAYLFNSATGKLVMRNGGGQIWILTELFFASNNKQVIEEGFAAIKALEAFIVANPEGGDVTEIIMKQSDLSKRAGF